LSPLNFLLTSFREWPNVREGMPDNHSTRRFARARSTDRSPDNRERITGARQAAEALFAPNPRGTEPSGSRPERAVEQSARTAGVSETSRTGPVPPAAVKVPTGSSTIPAAHLPRIRTWMRYGMTVPEVAQVYGVSIEEMKRVLREG
jgi:hypothetical protein